MANLPKGFRKDIKITHQPIGFEQRQDMLDDIARKGTFLPRGVMYEDMDSTVIEFIEKDLSITIEGEKVPVLFLTLQRWSEFSQSWQFADKYKDIKMPFITIVRLPNPQVGRNQAGLFNIPGRRSYTYMKIPTFEGGRVGVDTYKIPQPTSVDLTYEVRLFCNRMKDLNQLNQLVQKIFQSRQHYVRVNGHPMPLHLESIGDESNIDDFENRRFYVQPFEMVLYGYILDENDFEVIPSINRIFVATEIDGQISKVRFKILPSSVDDGVIYNFIFQKGSNPSQNVNSFSFVSDFDGRFTSIENLINISNIEIKSNNVVIFNGTTIIDPLIFNKWDNITITITRTDNNGNSTFSLIGNSLNG
jgi:hypothetical protein